MINEKMKYETFTEFCERAYELRELYQIRDDTPLFLMEKYRDYVYSHKYTPRYEATINGLCWEWLLSSCYEAMNINDLYSQLGKIKKGQ